MAAVAAVAGASAALVAGLTVTAAIRTQDAAEYVPRTAYGVTTVYADCSLLDPASVADRVREAVPDARVAVSGDPTHEASDSFEVFRSFWLPSPGCSTPPSGPPTAALDPCWTAWLPDSARGWGPVVVDAEAADLRGFGLTPAQRSVLDSGGVLVHTGSQVDVSAGRVAVAVGVEQPVYTGTGDPDPTGTGVDRSAVDAAVRAVEVPAVTWDPPPGAWASTYGVTPSLLLSPQAARLLEAATVAEVYLLPAGVDAASTPEEVGAATEPLLQALPAAVARQAQTEVGYVDRWRVVDLVVVLAAAIVVLGATFTATALALADARRDRTVLTALGAAPRTQRAAAGATAALISGTGALVGGAVGLLVGLVVAGAVLQPTVASVLLQFGAASSSTTLEVVPWGWLAAFVVGLPLLAGVVVAAVAKGRPGAEASRATARVD